MPSPVLVDNPPLKYISIHTLHMSKCVCKIMDDNMTYSGFLIKFFKGNSEFFCLMTNEHSMSKEKINQKKKITFTYNNETKISQIILLPEERYIKDFRDINIDATVIEILPKDNIPKDYFLLPNIDYFDNFNSLLNKEIELIQYSSGELNYSNGKIKEINGNEFIYLASTSLDSSGSPISLNDSSKVIGIHKGVSSNKKENYGDFIYPIFKFFKDFSENKIGNDKDSIENNIYEISTNNTNDNKDENTIENNNIIEDEISILKEENINLKQENKTMKEIISRYPFKLLKNEFMLTLIIMTKDEKVIFSLICKNTDKFIKIQEKFYKKYPEYLENKGTFKINSHLIQNNKTLEESNIKDNDIIIFEEFKTNILKNEINIDNNIDDEEEVEIRNKKIKEKEKKDKANNKKKTTIKNKKNKND